MITTPFSFVASANCVLYEQATPVFCDIDPRTLNIEPAAAEAAVSTRTTGLLPVHIFGYPADMPGFERLAVERGLWIVEDTCEALGATHADGLQVGARGNLAVFGFYPNKQLTTGEGGAVVCPDEATKQRIDSERNQGRAPDMGWLDHDRSLQLRLTTLVCARARQLERLDEMRRRARVAALYSERSVGRGPDPALPHAGGARRSWSCTWFSSSRAATAPRRWWPCARRGTPSPTCRRSTDELLPRALRPPRRRVTGLREVARRRWRCLLP